jgi:uncharacterized NAD(P)/FAD-binding protein YdhS
MLERSVGRIAVIGGANSALSEDISETRLAPGSAAYSPDMAVLVTEGETSNPAHMMSSATGPSAVDCVARLLARGHRGPIYLLTRHGLMPLPGECGQAFAVDVADIPVGTSLAYFLRWLRSLIRWCNERGYDWPSVVDGLKPHAEVIWQHLSSDNRKRFLVHARAWWEAHIHRPTPSAVAAIRNALASGQLTVLAGRLTSLEKRGERISVTFKPRRGNRMQHLVVGRWRSGGAA